MDEAQADFALNLIRTATTNDESVILSPFSIALTLAMAYVGAEGKTKKQMANVLSKGELQQVNFTQEDAVEKTVAEINKWVMQQTSDKIKNLVSQSDINSNTKLVEMMTVEGYFPYYEDDNIQVLGIPYSGDEIHLYIVLPQKQSGLLDIEKNLTGKRLLDYIQSCIETQIQVEMPKFKIEKKVELVNSLKEMGMNDAFTSAANFTGITDLPLYINAVLHKSFIEVNEEGTEATSASAIEMRLRSAPITFAPIKLFHADHPYLLPSLGNLLPFYSSVV
ncbi:Serpin B9 [Dirofilaria immitis]|nr:Serpin B9 [Dirofilaria immitis]